MTKETDLAFLEEYKTLCIKHDRVVESCGCCGSPWVTEPNAHNTIEDNFKTLEKNIENAYK